MSTTPQAKPVKVTDWFGFDVSKATLDWSQRRDGLPPADAKVVRTMTSDKIKRTREVLVQWYADHVAVLGPQHRAGVVMEATSSYSLEVAAWLRSCDEDIHISVIAPKRARRYADMIGMNNKTDDIDGRVMACFGAERNPAPLEKPDATTMLLRPLTRGVLSLTEQRVSVLLQRKELDSEHLDKTIAKVLRQSFDKVLATLDKQIETLQAEITKALVAHPELKAMVDKLDQIPGVGAVVATTIIAELGDLTRFTRSRQLAAFAGLNPVVCRSGTSVNKRTRMSKCGSSRSRRVLYLSAMVNCTRSNPFGALYKKLTDRGMHKMAALGVIMRRTLMVMRAVLQSGSYNAPLLYTRWHLDPTP